MMSERSHDAHVIKFLQRDKSLSLRFVSKNVGKRSFREIIASC